MRVLPTLLLVPAFLASGCADAEAPARAATATFAAFQQALRNHDENACRRLLTSESAVVISSLPWQSAAESEPLCIDGAEAVGSAFHVRVRDPNQGGAEATFVVVREYGALVVDLVASAACNAVEVEREGAAEADFRREEFEPRELTPADYDRIRQHELSQPKR